VKQISKTALIGGKAAMISQEHVSHEHNPRMADQRILVTALDLLGQAQVLFDHFEKHADVPAFPVGMDYRRMVAGIHRFHADPS
jgi:hypothetical protein